MSTADPRELDWLVDLVPALATGTFTQSEAVAALGEDAGRDRVSKGRRVIWLPMTSNGLDANVSKAAPIIPVVITIGLPAQLGKRNVPALQLEGS